MKKWIKRLLAGLSWPMYEPEVTFDDARTELWNLQRQIEQDGTSTPETTEAVLNINKLLDEAEAKYKANKEGTE
jgi:hypothetical protein